MKIPSSVKLPETMKKVETCIELTSPVSAPAGRRVATFSTRFRSFLAVERLPPVAIDKAVEAVWRRLEKSDRLRVKDFVVLLIAAVREEHARVNETNKRIEALEAELSRRIDEANKRIDGVYGVLGDMQKTMAAMQNTLLEILKVLTGIQRDMAELKRTR